MADDDEDNWSGGDEVLGRADALLEAPSAEFATPTVSGTRYRLSPKPIGSAAARG